MSDENRKNRDASRGGGIGEVDRAAAASRARNRTVLLTPETIGQVRDALTGGPAEDPAGDQVSELLPPLNWDYPEGQGAASTAARRPTSRANAPTRSRASGRSVRSRSRLAP